MGRFTFHYLMLAMVQLWLSKYRVFRLITILLLTNVICIPSVTAQWYRPENMGKKAQMVYNLAIDKLSNGAWLEGKTYLQTLVKTEPRYVEAWLSLMSAYGEKKMYDSAIVAFNTAWQLDSVFSKDLLLPYSINLAGNGQFEAALKAANTFLSTVQSGSRSHKAASYRIETYAFAMAMNAKNNRNHSVFTPFNLGDSVNSAKSEYYPSFTIDDSLLVFTRLMGGIREDFFVSKWQNGSYQKASTINGTINELPSKGGINISSDGNWLFFAGNFEGQGFGNFDLYSCQATPQGWSEPYNLGSAINTEFWESSPSLSPDKQTLYFSSNRPGGFGGKDLYVSHKLPNGKWSFAENMGGGINTSSDELAPFIHADNQTLYFTSGGHPGYGGSDIYLIRKGPNGYWSVPENLGYPINTIDDDGSLIVAANGTKAFFASYRSDSRGGLDLYSFNLPANVQAKKTSWVKGCVMDAISTKGLPSSIVLKDLKTGQTIQQITTDEKGNFLITLPNGSNYDFTVQRKGYFYFSNQFNLLTPNVDSTFRKDILLQPIIIDAKITLQNIYFATNSFQPDSSSFSELDKISQLLLQNPTIKVEIGGHTDNVGLAKKNMVLSMQRATAIVAYLVKKGIPSNRLIAKGYGATKPISSNNTEQGRQQNRRTELKVTGT